MVSGIELCTRRPTSKISQKLDEVFGLDQFFEALYPASSRRPASR